MAVEAATVVFGQFRGHDGKDGRVCLAQWLKKYCLDYRLRADAKDLPVRSTLGVQA